ncbi:hypothetical protein HB780_21635 [Rhizobium lusitanum]|uniref:hypothetical protein n=1 Tax=Rhizobium lusitanum TaxID=293958 RepID=UPI001620BE15|nr:hypothetical protein [Rhizobium lusitanum]QND48225.1 hypothetical protein HB780_21635 [Rhizobium lusitanum]
MLNPPITIKSSIDVARSLRGYVIPKRCCISDAHGQMRREAAQSDVVGYHVLGKGEMGQTIQPFARLGVSESIKSAVRIFNLAKVLSPAPHLHTLREGRSGLAAMQRSGSKHCASAG